MADEGNQSGSGENKMIRINVKTPKEQHTVEVAEDGLVKDVSDRTVVFSSSVILNSDLEGFSRLSLKIKWTIFIISECVVCSIFSSYGRRLLRNSILRKISFA
jgi:hypothetical protein